MTVIGLRDLSRFLRCFSYRALLLGVSLLLCSGVTFSHQGEPPKLLKAPLQKLSVRDELVLSGIDANKLKRDYQSKQSASSIQTKTIEFAVTENVTVNQQSHGSWLSVNGGDVWRLSVKVPGATDLNFGFTKYWLPKGATLHVYSAESRYYQGPYTAQHNYQHGQLWTPLTPGSEAVIEVFVPTGLIDQVQLELGRVGKGYRDVFTLGLDAIIKQGSCNIDVICSDGDGWRDEIRSVAVYGLNGGTFCTGTLINNVAEDFTPFFLTANHCGIDAADAPSVVTYWNFESPSCGDLDGGSLSQNTSGATFRANNVANDMTLLELNSQPASSYNVHYAGWDARTNLNPSGSVGIHHPNTDEKAISFNDDALATSNSCIGPTTPGTHWIVDNWEQGTTEPGSSGSALFDPATKRLIGYLSGGSASCSNTNGLDCYGKFSVGWSLGLSTWLDPTNTGTSFVDGIDPTGVGNDDPLVTRLGDTVSGLSVAVASEWIYGETDVPSGLSEFIVMIEGASSGDPDLYQRLGLLPTQVDFDCRPFLGGLSAETCNQPAPTAGSYFWGVRAFEPFAGLNLSVKGLVGIGDIVSGLSEAIVSEWSILELIVPAGTENLSIALDVTGIADDPDLFVRFGAQPTSDQYDCRPFSGSGVDEQCDFTTPQAGTYFIGVNAFSPYSNVTLEIDGDSPQTEADTSDILDFLPAIIAAATQCKFPKIGVSGTVSGELATTDLISVSDKVVLGSYADYYLWEPDGGAANIQLQSNQIDSYLTIRQGCDPTSDILFFNDDGGVGLNSELRLNGLSGKYLIEVTSFGINDTGEYQLNY